MITNTINGFRLSSHQKRLWLLQQNSSAYFTQGAILITGNLEPKILKAALQQVVNRHEILRTKFCRLPSVKIPIMVVSDNNSFFWEDIDLSYCYEQEHSSKIEELFRKARGRDFDFEQDPVMCLSLLKVSPNKHILLVSLPALCADVQTIKNLINEISHSYCNCLQEKELCNEVVQYLQFSEWQNQLLADEDVTTANEYWRQQKLSSLATFKLPFEKKNLNKLGFDINCFQIVVEPELTASIENLARKYNTSTAIVLFSCWQTLIWRLTGQSDIIIGTACARREYAELHDVLGLLATWIPIKSHLTPDLRFQEVLAVAEKTLGDAAEWQDYFVPEPVGNDNFLAFPIGFEFEQLPEKCFANGVSFSLERYYSCIEPFKVKLTCTQYVNALNLDLYYDVDYFSSDTIQRILGHFQTLLTSVTANPEEKICQLEILSKSDRQQLLVEFNQTQVDFLKQKCIHQLFEEQVKQTPNNIAVVFEDQQLTYAELNRKANQLAHYLQQQGVKPEVVVGLCVERSLEMIIGLLGILKAGGAYLPLDPTLPNEGIAFRIWDARVSLIVSHNLRFANSVSESFVNNLEPLTIVYLDRDRDIIAEHSDGNPSSKVTSENLVYVMFTSGSTGKPKGVAIEHQQLVNYLNGITQRLNLPTSARFASVSTLAADLGNTVIFPSLCAGGCLHIISSKRITDPAALTEYCRRYPIDCLKIVPSHLASLLASASFQFILPGQRLILGGEVATWDLIEQIQQQAPECIILNHYGPTEATVGVTTFKLKSSQDRTSYNSETVPLGRPLANTQIYLLDKQLQPVPIGVPGELYIGGASLSRGYLNRSELTAERFIPNPFVKTEASSSQSQERLYKTGDLARYLSDGNIEFIGRIDRQVKIRGFRIELGEIETLLCQHSEVRQAVVAFREEELNNKRLVAYIVPKQKQTPSISDLHKFLKQNLPEYMMPSAFIVIKALPLTPNGKVNYQALPEPNCDRPELEVTYKPPRTEIERTIATIWQEMLNLEKVGINDNFFELGGHSLLIVQIHSKLKKSFNKDLSITDLFEHPTINSLVNYLSQEPSAKTSLEQSHSRAESRLLSRKLRTQQQ